MNSYELVFIVKDEKEETLKKIQQLIEDAKGKIASQEKWGKKTLAYPIKKLHAGYYFVWKLAMEQGKVQEFKKKLEFDENILRYLLLKIEN